MTREQAKKWIKEIEAFANGVDILWYSHIYTEWETQEEPNWLLDGLYVINDNHVEARKAHALGEPVEYYESGEDRWKEVSDPKWYGCNVYRPKSTWKPKAGEMIEVRNSENFIWVRREFIVTTKDGTKYITHTPAGTNAGVWKQARELQW